MGRGGRSFSAYMLVVAIVFASAGGGLLLWRSGFETPELFRRGPVSPSQSDQPGTVIPSPNAAPAVAANVEDRVNAVRPALRATIAEGVSKDVVDKVRAVPGVAAAASVLLANLTIEVPGGGEAEVSVAAIDPFEFRPLAPEASAQAKFVWEGLLNSETFIAHEEFEILGGKPLTKVAAKGPNGRAELRVAGLAANGVPNLAGAMMSLQQADALGLRNPTLLMVGLTPDAPIAQVITQLGKVVPGVRFEETRPLENRTFLTGSAAQRAIGSFRYVGNDDGTIRQDSSWVRRNITSRNVPILGRVQCHRVIFPQLEAALTEIQNSGLAGEIKPGQFGGCYFPRFIERDGNRPLSLHAWGLALDINTLENPKGATPRMNPQIVAIFEKWGFRWGGRWSPPDGHHFELAALIKDA